MGGRCGGGGKEGGRDLGGGKGGWKGLWGWDLIGWVGRGGCSPHPHSFNPPPLKAPPQPPWPRTRLRGAPISHPLPLRRLWTGLPGSQQLPGLQPLLHAPPSSPLCPLFSPPSLNSSLLPLPPPLTRTTLTWCTASLAFASAPNPAAERSFPWPTTSAATCSSTPVRPSLFLCPPIPLFFSPQTFSPPQASGNSAARAAADPSSVKTTWRCTGGRTRGRRRFSKRERGGGCGFPPPSPL